MRYEISIQDPKQPLAVFIHGRGGNLQIMTPFYRCVPKEWNRLLLEAPLPDPDVGGYSWWPVEEQERAFESVPPVLDLFKKIHRDHRLTQEKVVALGFSQGAALLSLAIQLQPERFSKVVLLAGFVLEQKESLELSKNLPQVLMLHGTQDATISIEKARQGATYLRDRGYSLDLFEEDVGHKIGSQGMKRIQAFMA